MRIVYVETAWNELLRRNATRMDCVPEAVLRKMVDKLEVPAAAEASSIEFVVSP